MMDQTWASQPTFNLLVFVAAQLVTPMAMALERFIIIPVDAAAVAEDRISAATDAGAGGIGVTVAKVVVDVVASEVTASAVVVGAVAVMVVVIEAVVAVVEEIVVGQAEEEVVVEEVVAGVRLSPKSVRIRKMVDGSFDWRKVSIFCAVDELGLESCRLLSWTGMKMEDCRIVGNQDGSAY